MKKLFLIALLICGFTQNATAELKPGDLVFHTSRSSQSLALQLATNSPYSHMGVVLFRNGKPYVFEASTTVRFTPLTDWIERGRNGMYQVKRLKDESLLGPSSVRKLETAAAAYLGKPYDRYFEWSDDRIYCSELVWKMYYNALGIQIGRLQSFKDFDTSHPVVRAKLIERFGEKKPTSQKVISPAAMFQSSLLKEIR